MRHPAYTPCVPRFNGAEKVEDLNYPGADLADYLDYH